MAAENMEANWRYAEAISYESGFEFTDRYGTRQNVGAKPTFLREVVDMFLRMRGPFRVLGVQRRR